MKRIKLSEEQFKQLVELNMDDLIGTEVIDKPIYGMNTLNTEQESIDVEPDVEGYVSLEETDEIDEGADLEGPSKYGYGNDAPFKDSPNFNVGESVTADTLGDVIKYAIRETLNEEWENPCDGVGLNPTQYEDCLGNCCATMGGECCNEKTTGIGKGMTSDSKSVMDSEGALKRTELIKKKMALRDKQVQRKKMNENSHHLVHRTHEAEEYSMNKTKGGGDPCACNSDSDCKDAVSSGCNGNKCRDSKCVADGGKTIWTPGKPGTPGPIIYPNPRPDTVVREIEEAGCRYCTFVYDPDGYPIADEEGERLLDCWFDDCNASVVPGTWCDDCPKGVKDTKDIKTSDNTVRRHDMEMARRRPYSAKARDMRGSRDMGKMNEIEKKKNRERDDDCMCMKWEQVQADTWKCVQDKPVGCITGSGMTTKKDKKEMRESKYTRNRTNIERFLNEQVAQCDSPCSKQCGDLPIPQSWYDMVDTKGCNFVTNRMNNMQQRIDDMLTDPTNPQGEHCNCQFKRLQCKMNYLKDRKISLGC